MKDDTEASYKHKMHLIVRLVESGNEMARGSIRLRASRLAAGFLTLKDGATAAGVSRAAYQNSESVKLSENVLYRAATTFGVSPSFLSSGKVESGRDGLASRLQMVIEDASSEKYDRGETALRLKRMRSLAGFDTAAAACERHGWLRSAYSTHESGYSPIPLDRLVGYALSLGGRPEYLVSGKLPVMDAASTEWVNLKSSDLLPEGKATLAWTWLRSVAPGLAVLTHKDGTVKLSEERLQIPSVVSPVETHGGDGNRYAYISPVPDGVIHVISAVDVEGPLAFVDMQTGAIMIREGPAPSVPKDPTRVRTDVPRFLGGLVRRIRIADDGTD